MIDEIKEMNLSEMLFNRDERLLDYITDLQEENEKAKKTMILHNAILEERNDTIDYYKTIINEALEALKDTNVNMPSTLLIETIDYARHILKGRDK